MSDIENRIKKTMHIKVPKDNIFVVLAPFMQVECFYTKDAAISYCSSHHIDVKYIIEKEIKDA